MALLDYKEHHRNISNMISARAAWTNEIALNEQKLR